MRNYITVTEVTLMMMMTMKMMMHEYIVMDMLVCNSFRLIQFVVKVIIIIMHNLYKINSTINIHTYIHKYKHTYILTIKIDISR